MAERWKVCSACRKDIPFGSPYYACSVSTCNRTATKLVFCSVPCWDSHVAVLRHRDAWAIDEVAPASPGAAPRPVTTAAPPPAATRPVTTAAPPPLATRPATTVTPVIPPPPRVATPAPRVVPPPSSAPSMGSPSPSTPQPSPPPLASPSPASSPPLPSVPDGTGPLALAPADESDILVVVSKMKKYIRDRSGMNTSDAVAERLSDHLRSLCDAAIRTAARDGRKTVLDRDVPGVRPM